MKAYRLSDWKTPGQLVDIPVPDPLAGQVLVKVGGNGICQSDLHMLHEWTASPPHLDIRLPMTLGHEIGGWVEELGPGVSGFEIGQPCLVTIAGCGHCRACAEGWNNYCQNLPKQAGMGLDGGLAEYTAVPAAGIVPIISVEPWRAAPLTDAGLSSYHAVKRVLPLLSAGSTVVVIGVGGLGHMAVAAIKAICPAYIVAVDRDEAALSLAKEMGADLCLRSDGATVDAIRKSSRGGQVDAVLDFVGAGVTIGMAAQIIRPLGHIAVAGRGQGSFEFKDRALPYGAIMSTTFGGSKRELMELIALAEAGKIQPHVTPFPLSQVEIALEKLKQGEITGRAVIIP
jgi:propanol-preferring alcohol dehydrogenase